MWFRVGLGCGHGIMAIHWLGIAMASHAFYHKSCMLLNEEVADVLFSVCVCRRRQKDAQTKAAKCQSEEIREQEAQAKAVKWQSESLHQRE